MTDRPTAPADELGDPLVRYWDALLAGEPPDATALDPAIPATIGRFLARDDAPPPDPAFVRNLRARFAAPLGDLPADRLAVADFEPACPASVAGVAPLPAEPEPIRPWWSWLEFAAAILILVAAGGILLGRDR